MNILDTLNYISSIFNAIVDMVIHVIELGWPF